MAHGERCARAHNNSGKELWGKRPLSGESRSVNRSNRSTKKLYHKIERLNAKKELLSDLNQ